MEQRSHTAAQSALFAAQLGRQMRTELYVTVLADAVRGLFRICREGALSLAGGSVTPAARSDS
jgi:hypothetical protein